MNTDTREIQHALERYGLTKNEAAVYIALLKKLESTAFEVAQEAAIPRATVYLTLESLKRQGIVSQFRKNNIAHFTPESPNQLLKILKRKEEMIEGVLPQIHALTMDNIDAPKTKLFTGIDGIKTGLEDILETLKRKRIKQICATSQPDLLRYLPKYFPNWLQEREALGVFTKLILPSRAKRYLETNKLREVRYLPDKFPFTCSVTIYGNKMAFFSFQGDEPYCVIIESTSIAEMFLRFFEFSWTMLGR